MDGMDGFANVRGDGKGRVRPGKAGWLDGWDTKGIGCCVVLLDTLLRRGKRLFLV